MTDKKREVVITGMGLDTALGAEAESIFASWLGQKNNFKPISAFNVQNTPVQFAGLCQDPDLTKLPDRKVQKILRRKDLLSLLTTLKAAEHAGLRDAKISPERMGMYVGASSTQIGDLTPYFTLVAECADLTHGRFDSQKFGHEMLDLVNPLVVLQTLMNNALCFGTMTLDLRGVNANFMDFQVSGLRALGEGFQSIRNDRADLIIAGGVAGPIEPFQLAEGVQVNYLADTSRLQTSIGDVIRPWDKGRVGTILSEGTAYLVLEEKEHALARGAAPLAVVKGFGIANDGQLAIFSPAPATGLEDAIGQALAQANLSPDDLGGIIGHGNGSKIQDWSEIRAYQRFMRNRKNPIPLTTAYPNLGDMCEASGASQTILGAMALKAGLLPATANHVGFEETLHHVEVMTQTTELAKPSILVTSRNFFGLACALVLGRV